MLPLCPAGHEVHSPVVLSLLLVSLCAVYSVSAGHPRLGAW